MRMSLLLISCTLLLTSLLGCTSDETTETAQASLANPHADSESIESLELEVEITGPETAVSENDAESSVGEAADDEIILIDVRTKREWDAGHIRSSIHIPHTEIADRISEVTEDKQAPIVVFCAVGGRSAKAKKTLEGLGFSNVTNAGGYNDIKDQYPE